MEIKHTIILKDKKYEFSVDYARGMQILPKIPQEIGYKLFRNEEYIAESQVRPEIFQNFLEYWKNSKEPEINSDNMYEYFLLCQEFKLMVDYFAANSNEKDLHISSLKYISQLYLNDDKSNTLINKSQHERYIAMNLDTFLKEDEKIMLKIPINSLFNIFFHKERVLYDQQIAFDFIDKNKMLNSELLLLLPSLNTEKLDRKKIVEYISKAEENFGIIPQISPSFFSFYDEQISKITQSKIFYQKAMNTLIGNFLIDNKYEPIKSILYDKNFDVNSRIIFEIKDKRYDIPPLYIAIISEDIELIQHLFKNPEFDVNIRFYIEHDIYFDEFQLYYDKTINGTFKKTDIFDYTPLYFAIMKGNIKIIELLLSNDKLDVNSKSIEEVGRKTLISLKLPAPILELAKSLVDSPETFFKSEENLKKIFKFVRSRKEETVLNLAIDQKNIIDLLLARKDLDINNTSIYQREIIKIEVGDKILMDSCENLSEKTALHLAIENDNSYSKSSCHEIVKLLLDRPDLDINKSFKITSNTIFSLISFVYLKIDQKVSIINLLNKLNASLIWKQIIELIQIREDSPLNLAIANINDEIVRYILARDDLDINIKHREESYSKINISDSEKVEVLKAIPDLAKIINDKLIESKKIEETALHIAVKNYYIGIITALLEKKIDIDATNADGKKAVDLTHDPDIISLINKSQH